ncbi:uncharacterized protein LOC142776165 [Rhipicephalus microplus]|uniref:uncharacterized protein LOC142776165 n=1 Tax=Rhipicephalus microplus TaxID=6941 RepID=UPI003F6D27EF
MFDELVITVPKLTSLPLNVPLSVWMSNFVSPTKFWLRLVDGKNPYIRRFVWGCEIHLYGVEIGQYCVADTRRSVADLAHAVVTDVFRETGDIHLSAQVFFIDHCHTLVLGMDRLFPLAEVDATTPRVAIPCSLHRVATRSRHLPKFHLPPESKLEAVFGGVSDMGTYQTRLFILRKQVDGTLAKFDVAREFTGAEEMTDILYLRP